MKLKNLLFVLGFLLVGAGCAPRVNTYETPPRSKEVSVKTEFTAEDRTKWQQIAQWPDLCDEDFKIGSDAGQGGLALFPINGTESILRVACGVYAYQNNSLFYLVTNLETVPSARLLSIPTYNFDTKQVTERVYEYEDDIKGSVLGLDSFDPINKTLTIFTKDRGVGDCGTREIFTMGNELTLTKVYYQSCEAADAWHLKNPEAESMPDWPIIYEKK